ncbi:universal stress protein [Halobaculum halobium]|uniref:Universal stress protein n=1 Tax=Halobaculum halobium TaxID=3032281 RepID=A0ABD5T6E3_9EURY|nr:universal stress protein [Halobaculum sp. SYNS20]
MGLVVPYDGSTLSDAALVRANQFDCILEEGVTAVTVIPKGNRTYARDHGWIGSNETYDTDVIVETLRQSVHAIVPDARFEPIFVGSHAPFGTIAGRIRRFARDNDTSIVFLGSDNAGRMVGSLSVGGAVTADKTYDTMIISQSIPAEIEKLEEELPCDELLARATVDN